MLCVCVLLSALFRKQHAGWVKEHTTILSLKGFCSIVCFFIYLFLLSGVYTDSASLVQKKEASLCPETFKRLLLRKFIL